MTTKQKIEAIFAQETANRHEMAKWYSEQAKSSRFENERKEFERQAWIEGVKVHAILGDIKKRVLKCI
jgi:hypothetical protein